MSQGQAGSSAPKPLSGRGHLSAGLAALQTELLELSWLVAAEGVLQRKQKVASGFARSFGRGEVRCHGKCRIVFWALFASCESGKGLRV